MANVQFDRRLLLRGIGMAGAIGVTANLFGGKAFAAEGTMPFDLHFQTRQKYRPFDLISPNFVQFDTAQSPSNLTVTGGTLISTKTRPRAPYGAVLVEVQRIEGDAGVLAGLVGDNSSVLAAYDAGAGTASIEITIDGKTTVLKSVAASFTAPFQFACVFNENAVTVLADPTGTGHGWQPLLTERDSVRALIDLRAPSVLGRLSYAYGGRGESPALLGRVRAGYFGQAGVRDPHVVQHADGRPYIMDGKLYLTMTNAGLGFFQQAHWGVWTLGLADPIKLEQVAQLFSSRDGVVLGDHAGQIVYDEQQGRFIELMTSWGDFNFDGVHVRHATTEANVLSGVHVIPTELLPLPTEVSSWDPALTKIDGRWHIAFVESPAQKPNFIFHPALAAAPAGADYFENLELLGADLSVDQTEGTILQRFGSDWYVLASDGDGRVYRVYDFGMRQLGTLDASYGTNIPHPMVLPVGGGKWWMLTFDGTQYAEPVLGYGSHGDFILMEA